ncbi:Protein RDE-4, partial [Aphelenchoides avenae]
MASDGRSKLDRLFCHREVLRSREPELFERMEPIVLSERASSSKPPVPVAEAAVTKQPKTPAALLEECCQKVYNCQPTYGKKDAPIGMHAQVCIFKGYKGQGMARSKQSARHIAALEILRHIIKQNEWRKFGLPGNTAVEADSY